MDRKRVSVAREKSRNHLLICDDLDLLERCSLFVFLCRESSLSALCVCAPVPACLREREHCALGVSVNVPVFVSLLSVIILMCG